MRKPLITGMTSSYENNLLVRSRLAELSSKIGSDAGHMDHRHRTGVKVTHVKFTAKLRGETDDSHPQ